jgi:hypothetical protein
MRPHVLKCLAGIVLGALAQGVMSAPISFTAGAAKLAGVAETGKPSWSVGLEGEVGASLVSLGVDFGYGRKEGYFGEQDPNVTDSPIVYTFCGASASGECDFNTGIDGRIVLAGSAIGGATSFLKLEAGFFDEDSNPLLRIFDRNYNLLKSVAGVRSTSPTGQQQYAPLIFTAQRNGADIAFFDFGLSDGDDYQGFGLNRITLEAPTAVPIPGTLGLVGLGLLALGASRRRNPS